MGGSQSREPTCDECNCSDAAKELSKRVDKAAAGAASVGQTNVLSKLLSDDQLNAIDRYARPLTSQMPQDVLDALNQWRKIKPTTIESFANHGNNDNYQMVMNYIRNAVAIRHKAFSYDKTKFDQDCVNNAYKTINPFLDAEKRDLDTLYEFYETFLKDYESLYKYKSSMGSIIDGKRSELKNINNKIEDYKKNLFVDNRIDTYQRKNFDFYKSIYFYLIIIYYSLFVIYLMFSKFFSDKMYKNKKLLFFIGLYLLLPLILKTIFEFIVNSYINILEMNNLRGDVKSYQDMIDVY